MKFSTPALTRLLHEQQAARFISAFERDDSRSKASTRCLRTLLRVNPERKRRKSLESKPNGRMVRHAGATFGLTLLTAVMLATSTSFAQRQTSADITAQMIALDSEIEQEVSALVNKLASVEDSTDSGTQVAQLKTDVIKKLANSLKTYQQQRQIRLGELQQNYANLPREALSNQIENMDKKTQERVDQIVELTESFAQDEGFDKYEYTLRSNNRLRDDADIRRVSNPEYKQNTRAAAVGDQGRDQVEKGLEEFNRKLSVETTQLEQQLPAQRQANRPAIEAEIARNRETIAANEAKITELKNQHSPEQLQELSRDQAQDLKKEIDDAVVSLRAKHNELVRLKSERDRLLAMEKAAGRM